MIAVELTNINHGNKIHYGIVIFGIACRRMFVLRASAWPLSPNKQVLKKKLVCVLASCMIFNFFHMYESKLFQI